MKPSFGIGVLVIVLVSAAAALLSVVSLQGAISMVFLLSGIWAVIAAFSIVPGSDRTFYAGWGIIMAGLSLSYFIPIADALALILIAMVGLIVVRAYLARAPKAATAPSVGTSPAPASS